MTAIACWQPVPIPALPASGVRFPRSNCEEGITLGLGRRTRWERPSMIGWMQAPTCRHLLDRTVRPALPPSTSKHHAAGPALNAIVSAAMRSDIP